MSRRRIAVEDRAVLGEGDLLRRILHRLPVGVLGAALDVVDRLAIEIERHPQLDQRLDDALPREDAVAGRRDRAQMAGADGGQAGAARPVHVDDAPSGKVALEGARRLLLDLGPRGVGDRGELAMQVIHAGCLL